MHSFIVFVGFIVIGLGLKVHWRVTGNAFSLDNSHNKWPAKWTCRLHVRVQKSFRIAVRETNSLDALSHEIPASCSVLEWILLF